MVTLLISSNFGVPTGGENPESPSDGQRSQKGTLGKRIGMEIESDCMFVAKHV